MLTILKEVAEWVGTISAMCAGAAIFIKPLREKLFGIKKRRDAELCILRHNMLQIYRTHSEDKRLTEDEYTNFKLMYDAYSGSGGNSFVKKLWREIDDEWEILV